MFRLNSTKPTKTQKQYKYTKYRNKSSGRRVFAGRSKQGIVPKL
jgi:hypothetical protein